MGRRLVPCASPAPVGLPADGGPVLRSAVCVTPNAASGDTPAAFAPLQ
ncbi:hypothetical protein [Lysobacter gummosus]